MFSRLILKKLYLVHNGEDSPVTFKQLKKLLKNKCSYCQYRNKDKLNSVGKLALYQHARALQRLCRRYGVPFIVNDDFVLARRIGADGVHLGQQDIQQLRLANKYFARKSGKVGVTCHDSIRLAYQAYKSGASYVAFGALFQSQTKIDAKIAKWRRVRLAIASSLIDSVVIGGINHSNIKQVISLKPTAIAMSAGLDKII